MAASKGNNYAKDNEGGRPAILDNPDKAQKLVDEYFEFIKGEFHNEQKTIKNPITQESETIDVKIWDREPEPATITGLALYLGFESRQSLYDYEKNKEFSYIIKKAKFKVEHEYEKKLSYDKCTGSVFALKNMGWSDRMDIQQNNTNVNLNADLSEDDIKKLSKGLDEKY